MVVRNFLPFYVLPDRTPTGGKSQITGILGQFSLGRPLEIPGLGRKTGKYNFPVLGAFLRGIPDAPKVSPRNYATPKPHGREIAKYGVLRPFWPRTALGPWNFRTENRKTQPATLRPKGETNPLQLGPITQS